RIRSNSSSTLQGSENRRRRSRRPDDHRESALGLAMNSVSSHPARLILHRVFFTTSPRAYVSKVTCPRTEGSTRASINAATRSPRSSLGSFKGRDDALPRKRVEPQGARAARASATARDRVEVRRTAGGMPTTPPFTVVTCNLYPPALTRRQTFGDF